MKSTHTQAYIQAIAALISARKERRVLQADLALKLNKPQSFVSKYEARERRLDVVEFFEVCRAIGANPVAVLRQAGLLTDEDTRSPEP
ncbi:MAG: helix-turn-helix domain-containing protein [Magnetospirillum sp.]|nr:helix-turn-helix domain-containing protein [Magnetospirillum sp.]